VHTTVHDDGTRFIMRASSGPAPPPLQQGARTRTHATGSLGLRAATP
jgi:hypothetical protein